MGRIWEGIGKEIGRGWESNGQEMGRMWGGSGACYCLQEVCKCSELETCVTRVL